MNLKSVIIGSLLTTTIVAASSTVEAMQSELREDGTLVLSARKLMKAVRKEKDGIITLKSGHQFKVFYIGDMADTLDTNEWSRFLTTEKTTNIEKEREKIGVQLERAQKEVDSITGQRRLVTSKRARLNNEVSLLNSELERLKREKKRQAKLFKVRPKMITSLRGGAQDHHIFLHYKKTPMRGGGNFLEPVLSLRVVPFPEPVKKAPVVRPIDEALNKIDESGNLVLSAEKLASGLINGGYFKLATGECFLMKANQGETADPSSWEGMIEGGLRTTFSAERNPKGYYEFGCLLTRYEITVGVFHIFVQPTTEQKLNELLAARQAQIAKMRAQAAPASAPTQPKKAQIAVDPVLAPITPPTPLVLPPAPAGDSTEVIAGRRKVVAKRVNPIVNNNNNK